MHISFESPVNSEAITDEDRRRADESKTLIERGHYDSHAKKEGGSGLLKIMKTISPHRVHDLRFGFTANATFLVELSLSLTPSIAQSEETCEV